MVKLPRKIKKGLKKALLKTIDPAWKSRHVRITDVSVKWWYMRVNPNFKGVYLTGYSLGVK